MNIEDFDKIYKSFKSHENIKISCGGCENQFNPLKTRAKQTIKKNGEYLCPSCGQKRRHQIKPMNDLVKDKIRQGVKNYYKEQYKK